MVTATGSCTARGAHRIRIVERNDRPIELINEEFERLLGKGARSAFTNWRPNAVEICRCEFSGAYLDGQFRAIYDKAGFIEGTSYGVDKRVLEAMPNPQEGAVHQADAPDRIVVGCNELYENYFHWVSQALPAIDCAFSSGDVPPSAHLALPPLNRWQEESLQLLLGREIPRVTVSAVNRRHYFPRLEYCNILAGSAIFGRSRSVARTFARLRRAQPIAQQFNRKIYVARRDAQHRQMTNEPALMAELAARGFEILDAGKLSFAEQVATFQSASFVIGPHGAGLTNIVFCHPGTVIYEILPQEYPNNCFNSLALLNNLHYWADAFRSTGAEHSKETALHLRNWSSDTRAVLARVDEIEALRTSEQFAKLSAINHVRSAIQQMTDDLHAPDVPATPSTQYRHLSTHAGTIVFADAEATSVLHASTRRTIDNIMLAVDGGTAHMLHFGADGVRHSVRLAPEPLIVGDDIDVDALRAPIQTFDVVHTSSNDSRFGLRCGGLFLCAEPNGRLTLSRSKMSVWEHFTLV